jgi:hypothetical protein
MSKHKPDSEELKGSADYKRLMKLVDWTFNNWAICKDITAQGKVVDICKQGGDSDMLIPLHELVRGDSDAGVAIATLIMFQKKGCKLSPCSKVEFFSDPNQINLVCEIKAGAEAKSELPPKLLNYGQLWAKVQPGSLALLALEEQR